MYAYQSTQLIIFEKLKMFNNSNVYYQLLSKYKMFLLDKN